MTRQIKSETDGITFEFFVQWRTQGLSMSSYTVSLAKGKLAYSMFGRYAFAALTSGIATGISGKKPWNALIAYLRFNEVCNESFAVC